jgi:hypothetical protein
MARLQMPHTSVSDRIALAEHPNGPFGHTFGVDQPGKHKKATENEANATNEALGNQGFCSLLQTTRGEIPE